jgi:hypothetical protein
MSPRRTNQEWANCYRRLGWSVIPVRPRAKIPLLTWEPFQTHAATAAQIARWLERWPDANLGVVTGAISGLVVLDVDPIHGGDGSLADLELRQGRLPQTVEAVTGGGGRHLYFKHPGGFVHNRASMAPGLDVRGDGGYVVAPPSVHPAGLDYRWMPGHDPTEIALAPLPGWVAETAADRAHPGHPIAYWRALLHQGVTEGSRNNSVAALTGRLLWHGVDPRVIKELLLCWNAVRCRPPLPESEVVTTIDSVRRTRERHRSLQDPVWHADLPEPP